MSENPLDYESPSTRKTDTSSRAVWWAFHIIKWIAIVIALTAIAFLTFMILITHYWQSLGPFPD